MNRLITFEGIEGSGKSTQVERAAAFLASRDVPHVVTREPGGTRLGDAIRRILLHPDGRDMVPLTELLLIGAARAQHLAEVVLPALREERVVLCDRFEDSTRTYQGDGRGLPAGVVEQVCALSAGGLRPGLTFLLDL
ncbi:MAG: dTMP kinase, partial [Acidobacteriota bacterium]